MVFFVPFLDMLIKLAKEQLSFLMSKIIHKAVKESSLNIYLLTVQVKSSGFQTSKKKYKRLVTHIFKFAVTIFRRCTKLNWYSLLLYTAIPLSLWAA